MNSALSPPTGQLPARPWLFSRNTWIALTVVGLHVGLIWALQSGLLMRTAELVVPAELIAQWVAAPTAAPAPLPPAAAQAPAPVPEKRKAITPSAPKPQPQPMAVTETTPAPTASAEAQAPAQVTAVAAAPAAAATGAANGPSAAAAAVQLPSSDADYLQNPKPPYPPLSERLGEQGNVIYKVWIGTDGRPQRAELVSSSGFARLDKAAYDTVMRWRYVPGKRNGVPEAMAFNVPIRWQLRNGN